MTYAFNNCRKLNDAELNEGLERIGMLAFSDCLSLKVIQIPSSNPTIASDAFPNSCKLLPASELSKDDNEATETIDIK